MITDSIVSLCSSAMSGMVDAAPKWQGSLDVSKVRDLINTLQAWNNWLPLDQICICLGIAVGLWIALQALAAAFKAVELVKP